MKKAFGIANERDPNRDDDQTGVTLAVGGGGFAEVEEEAAEVELQQLNAGSDLKE